MKGEILLKQLCAVCTVLFCIVVTGCRDDVKNIYKGEPEEPEEVPNDFDFSTGKEVQITISYDKINGYQVPFEMYTEIPVYLDESKDYVKKTGIKSFFYGKTDENGKANATVEIAAFVNDVYLYSEGLGVPRLMHASITGSTISAFKEIEVTPLSGVRSVNARSGDYTKWEKFSSIKLFTPSLNAISTTITDAEKKSIDNTAIIGGGKFSDGSNYLRSHITLQEDSEVKIYFVSHGTNERNNALAYYLYENGSEVPTTVNEKLQLAFPMTNGISNGEGYELRYPKQESGTVFPKGTSIGFALLIDAGNENPNNVKTSDLHILYSNYGSDSEYSFNSYNFPNGILHNRPHMVSFLLNKNDDKARIALCFEDQPFDPIHSSNKGDFRDDIFIIELNPKTAAPDDLPEPSKPELPEYGDTNTKQYGVLGFEDCWPDAGDYDLNDVVVAYERTFYMNNMMYAVALDEKFTFLYDGATYTNGFGYQLGDLSRSKEIKSVTVTSDYKCEGQGLDEDLDETVIMLFDNAKKVTKGMTFNVRTIFNEKILINRPLLNPFIVVKGGKYASEGDYMSKNRIEVHLPTPNNKGTIYFPTKKVNTELWYEEDDLSQPNQNIYYIRSGNYPFAINMLGVTADQFVIPAETKAVDETYPKFKNWVESSGKNDKDWYIK